MAGEVTCFVEVQLATNVWTDITADVRSRIDIEYGIQGNKPMDLTASTGECSLSMKNDTGNSGNLLGYYSPLHSNVRSGWTFGIPIRVFYKRNVDTTASVTSITRSSNTATVTTASVHGRSTGDWVTIAGANQSDYNGTFKITVSTTSIFTYDVLNTPVTPATGTITFVVVYVKHRGKIRAIDPGAGKFKRRNVEVLSYDGMRDLAEADAREVAIQLNQTEEQLLTNLLASLPTNSQPVSQSIDTGIDTHPYAFDDLGPGTKARSVVQSIAESSYTLVFVRGDGTFTSHSRTTRATGTSTASFTDTDGIDVIVPTDLEKIFNLVRLTISPRTIDDAATTVIWSATGAGPSVATGDTITIGADYRDPDETRDLIGATEVVTSPVENTDYEANTAADGTGSDISSDITVTVTPYSSTAKINVSNANASEAFLVDGSGNVLLQIKGKGIYSLGEQTFEATSVQDYGTRPLSRTLRYQSSQLVAQSYATFIEDKFNNLTDAIDSIRFLASFTDALLLQALVREPGDIITVTEIVTGLSAAKVVIHSVHLEHIGPHLFCTWGLAPSSPFEAWILGSSLLGQGTFLGF